MIYLSAFFTILTLFVFEEIPECIADPSQTAGTLFTFALFVAGSIFFYRRAVRKPYKATKASKVWMIIDFILSTLYLVSSVTTPEKFLSYFCGFLGFLAAGIELSIYRKQAYALEKPIKQEPIEEISVNEAAPEPICETEPELSSFEKLDRTLYTAKEASAKLYASDLTKELSEMDRLLTDLHEADHLPSDTLMNQMEEILSHYVELSEIASTPSQKNQLNHELLQSCLQFNQALINLHDQYFENKALDLTTDLKVLSMKLSQDGLLNSDFDLKNK